MKVSLTLNPKHERFKITAFFESLANSEHHVKLVYDKADLKDQEAEPSLENLGIETYMVKLVNSIVFIDGKGKEMVLHERGLFLTK